MAPIVERSEFKESLSKLPTGVSIIGTKFEGNLFGFTASSLTSVSLNPPLISFCLNKDASCLSAFLNSMAFSVSILAEGQLGLSKHFARHMDNKFIDIEYELGLATKCPLIKDAICWIECKKVHEYDAGDHIIFIGEVIATQINNNSNPLIYHARQYRSLK